MKLFRLTEGMVSTSRGRIVNIKNDMADELSSALQSLGFREPDVEFVDSPSEDAIVYANVSNMTIMLRVIADDEIQIQLPQRLAKMLSISDYYKAYDVSKAIAVMRGLRDEIRRLG